MLLLPFPADVLRGSSRVPAPRTTFVRQDYFFPVIVTVKISVKNIK